MSGFQQATRVVQCKGASFGGRNLTYDEAMQWLQRYTEALPDNRYPARAISPYEYWGQVSHIVDGDTFDVGISMGFDLSTQARIRLLGVDTPEIHGVKKRSQEFHHGQASMDYVNTLLKVGDWLELRIRQSAREKYGRWLAVAFMGDGTCLNALLIQRGYRYTGAE